MLFTVMKVFHRATALVYVNVLEVILSALINLIDLM